MIPLAVEVDNNQIMGAVVAALIALVGLYTKMRAWEKSLRTGDKIDIKQPLAVEVGEKVLTQSGHEAICGPLHLRVGALELEVRDIRLAMRAQNQELLSAFEGRFGQIDHKIEVLEGSLRTDIKEVLRAVSRLEGTKLS